MFGNPGRRQSAQGDDSKMGSDAPQPIFCVLWGERNISRDGDIRTLQESSREFSAAASLLPLIRREQQCFKFFKVALQSRRSL